MANVVKIPTLLRPQAGGNAEVTVEGASTVEELIAKLDEAHDGFKARMYDDVGELKRFVNIYVRSEDIRVMDDVATSLSDGDDVSIVVGMSGGAA